MKKFVFRITFPNNMILNIKKAYNITNILNVNHDFRANMWSTPKIMRNDFNNFIFQRKTLFISKPITTNFSNRT